MSKTLHILLWLLLPAAATAQITTLRSKTLPLQSLPQQLDSLTIAPESVEVIHPITRAKLSSAAYQLSNNFIRFDTALVFPPATHLLIRYRVLPFNLGKPLSRIDTSLLSRNAADRLIGVPYNPYESLPTPLLPERGMDYSGNYTRGISFGNNQNLVLNSQFNMQMAGNLGDLEVLAAITDNNIPLQPEGNTQQLREFDRIFIQVAKNQNKLIAGDYELVRPNTYFMNYFKKLQGATFSRQWTLPGASRQQGSTTAGAPKLDTKASVAIARGKFARNTLSAQEGNQGPYRLEGAEGERFIIVLAGTEKVFLDGQLMVRGLDADYVIDYNAGHITFTNRRLITKDRRIVVEFDYNVQNYTRSLYALNNEIRTGKYRLYLHTYSEQDGRQPVDEDFTPAQSEALRNAGDNPNGAISSSIDTVLEYSAFRVLYELRDTTVNGIVYTGILVFSTDSQRARYTAGFSQVGPGNGNYLLDPTAGFIAGWPPTLSPVSPRGSLSLCAGSSLPTVSSFTLLVARPVCRPIPRCAPKSPSAKWIKISFLPSTTTTMPAWRQRPACTRSSNFRKKTKKQCSPAHIRPAALLQPCVGGWKRNSTMNLPSKISGNSIPTGPRNSPGTGISTGG
jgi:hypothetical protein